MDVIEVKRKSDGKVVLQQVLQFQISSSMISSRRRMRVFSKYVRRELECQFEGITFKRFEVVFKKHDAKLHIVPDSNGMKILSQRFNPAVQSNKEQQ